MKQELSRFTSMMRRNHSWVFIGLETFIVGCYFVAVPDAVVGYTPFHISVSFLDHWLLAILWVALGLAMMINNLFVVIPDYNRILAYCLMFLWGFYATMMIMRDLGDPHPPMIGLASIFYLVIMLRILVLLLFDDPHQHQGGEPPRTQ